MSRVEELFRAFAAEFRAAGDADPRRYLHELASADRVELAALIDHFLAAEPPPPFDAQAFAAFRAEPAREALVRDLLDDAPAIVELRRSAGLTKAQVGEHLAAELGLPGRGNAAKAAYHDIETGQVATDRVRERIWHALSKLYGASAEQIRRGARVAFETPPDLTSPAFTRLSGDNEAPAGDRVTDTTVRDAFFVD